MQLADTASILLAKPRSRASPSMRHLYCSVHWVAGSSSLHACMVISLLVLCTKAQTSAVRAVCAAQLHHWEQADRSQGGHKASSRCRGAGGPGRAHAVRRCSLNTQLPFHLRVLLPDCQGPPPGLCEGRTGPVQHSTSRPSATIAARLILFNLSVPFFLAAKGLSWDFVKAVQDLYNLAGYVPSNPIACLMAINSLVFSNSNLIDDF